MLKRTLLMVVGSLLTTACGSGLSLPGYSSGGTASPSPLVLTLLSQSQSVTRPNFQVDGPSISTGDWVMIYSGADSSCSGGTLVASQKITSLPFSITSTSTTVALTAQSYRAKVITQLGPTYCSNSTGYDFPLLSNVSRMAMSTDSACALISDGTVKCWGYNNVGQLGDTTTTNHFFPAPVSGISSATQITLGYEFGCALLSDQTVKCWGLNSYGQLGNGNTTNQSAAVAVTGLSGVTQIAAGNYHACALLTGGSIKCWGYNNVSQLGDAGTTNHSTSVSVASLPTTATLITAGGSHTCALLSDTTVACWGSDSNGQIGNATTAASVTTPTVVGSVTGATDLVAGQSHTCALVGSGSVKCWGSNVTGQIGDGTTTDRSSATSVTGITNATHLASNGTVGTSVGPIGSNCALFADGTMKCWGYNAYGQLGDFTTLNRSTPVSVIGVTSGTSIATSPYASCSVDSNHHAQCWGGNTYGIQGSGFSDSGQTLIQDVPNLSGVTQLEAGFGHTCALLADQSVQCWGYNNYGQIGLAATTSNQMIPISVSGFQNAASLKTGYTTSFAVLSNGALMGTGRNSYNQMANGNTTDQYAPLNAGGLSGVSKAAPGSNHVCVLMTDQSVKCWGDNTYGQLGAGDNSPRSTPNTVPGLSVKKISSGSSFTCGLLNDGTVKCWGQNNYGQLGIGGTSNANSPTSISGLTGVQDISCGGYSTCALMSDSTVKCWGMNNYGQVGDGSSTAQSSPVAVVGLSNVSKLATGNYNYGMCAILADATVQCWGYNIYGQVGDGSTTNRFVPFSVPLTNVTSISIGTYHACALTSAKTVKCWGANFYGQMGILRDLTPSYVLQQ